MTLALKKAKNNKNQPLYDVEGVLGWINYVRKNGDETKWSIMAGDNSYM